MLALLVLAPCSPAASANPAEKEKGFVSLFDGVSLKGWDGDRQYWRVSDGAMVGEIRGFSSSAVTEGGCSGSTPSCYDEGGRLASPREKTISRLSRSLRERSVRSPLIRYTKFLVHLPKDASIKTKNLVLCGDHPFCSARNRTRSRNSRISGGGAYEVGTRSALAR